MHCRLNEVCIGDGKRRTLFYDNKKGKFIVTVVLSHEEYGRYAQEQTVADVDSVDFDATTGNFIVPLYMSPEEYTRYTQDKTLPNRYFTNVKMKSTINFIAKTNFNTNFSFNTGWDTL